MSAILKSSTFTQRLPFDSYEVQHQVILITPDLAQQLLLRKNTANRGIRKRHVTALAAAMKRGEWKLTHQGIAFSSDGVLLDGHHRLAAICEANMPIFMTATFGVSSEAALVMDQGLNRSIGDLIHVPPRIAQLLRLAVAMVGSGNARRHRKSRVWRTLIYERLLICSWSGVLIRGAISDLHLAG